MAGVPLPKLRAESRPDSSAGCSQQQLPESLEAANHGGAQWAVLCSSGSSIRLQRCISKGTHAEIPMQEA